IARGLYDASAYNAVQRRLVELLAARGAQLDGAYFCPHHPDITGSCECRKPGLLLFREAQAALGLDLARSVWVGDRVSDVQPPRRGTGRSPWETRCGTRSRGATRASQRRARTCSSGGSRDGPARPSRSTLRQPRSTRTRSCWAPASRAQHPRTTTRAATATPGS